MNILLFGDEPGIKCLIKSIPHENIIGIVGASIRPEYIKALKSIAQKLDIPFHVHPKTTSENYPEFKSWVLSLNIDLILVNSYSMLINQDIINLSKFGGINIHGALLPQYRGSNPTQWSIINGEAVTGVTLHEISDRFDQGPIIAQETVDIQFHDTWKDVRTRLIQAIDKILLNNLQTILDADWSSQPQSEKDSNYYYRRNFSDGLFVWDSPIIDIYNLIRALIDPLPGAYFINKDNKEVILNNYLTLNEVTYLKFNNIKNLYSDEITIFKYLHKNETKDLRDRGILKRESDVNLVEFFIQEAATRNFIGVCGVSCIDYKNSKLRIFVELFDEVNISEIELNNIVNKLLRFVWQELRIMYIYVRLKRDQLQIIDVFDSIGFSACSNNIIDDNSSAAAIEGTLDMVYVR